MQEIMSNGSDYERMKCFVYMQRGALKAQQDNNQAITGDCFDTCITTFSTTHLDATEKKCLSQCVQRKLNAQERLQTQFTLESQKKQGEPQLGQPPQ